MIIEEAQEFYSKTDNFPLKTETYQIIGLAMEVHKVLGKGFLEIVYKDALELELQWANIPYEREKRFPIDYKGHLLKRGYKADFYIFDKIIVEAKAQSSIASDHYKQTINYLACSEEQVGLILNFGEDSLKFRRVIFSK